MRRWGHEPDREDWGLWGLWVSGVVRPYGDTTGDGRVQLSFTLPVPFGDEAERARAEGAALQLAAKMGMDPAMVVHAKGMGPDFTFFIVYGRVSHVVDLSAVTVADARVPGAAGRRGEPADPFGARPQAGRGRRVHRHRRAHGRHRRDPQRQGARGGEGPGVLPGDPRGEHGVAGRRRRPGGARRRRARRRGAGQPGRHPARRAPDEHPGDGGGVPRRVRPGEPAAAAGGGRPAVRPERGARPRRGQDLRPRHHTERGGQLPGARARLARGVRGDGVPREGGGAA